MPVGVEGANGGTVFESATCRDGLQVALAAAQAESTPALAREWLRVVSGTNQAHSSRPTRVPTFRGVTLPELIASVPVNSNVMLKLSCPPAAHGEVKRRLEQRFRERLWDQTEVKLRIIRVPELRGNPNGQRAYRRRKWRMAVDAVPRRGEEHLCS